MTGNKVPCPVCGEMFEKRGLNGHMRTHEKGKKKETGGVKFQFEEAPEEGEEEGYTCGKCNTPIKEGVPICPGCGGAFTWD